MKSINNELLAKHTGGDFDDCIGTAIGAATALAVLGGLAGAVAGGILVFGGGLLYCEAVHR